VLDLAAVTGLLDLFRRLLHVQPDGTRWSSTGLALALVLLNLVGGDCVEDIDALEHDPGLREFLFGLETFGLKRKERRALAKKRRAEEKRAKTGGRPLRAVPSRTTLRGFLAAFHDAAEEEKREPHKAFIPAPNEHLRALYGVNQGLVAFQQKHAPQRSATLDLDASLVETCKQVALFCYKHFRAYQPFQVYWYEQKMLLHSEFRDGNVPAGHEQLRVLQESLAMLPDGVEHVSMRSDTAGYQWDLLKYCAEGRNERFGVIDFAVGVDVSPEFRKAVAQVAESDWQPLLRRVNGRLVDDGQQWAEVCFVPNDLATSKKGPTYRFLAIREPFHQTELPLPDPATQAAKTETQLPFPTMDLGPASNRRRYKLFGAVTNRHEMPGADVIAWLRERCGKSEEVHAILKSDQAGGQLPSKLFGANAAWWAFAVITFNLVAVLKALVLDREWANARLKRLRLHIFALPGQVLHHARQLIVRLPHAHPALPWLVEIRQTILALAASPPAPA
jgi:hypothetical protein